MDLLGMTESGLGSGQRNNALTAAREN